jgi:glutaminyl-tRNA synthetase
MAVLDPIKLILTNYDDSKVQAREIGGRICTLSSEILINKDDFMLNPIDGFHRLKPGGEVRLRHSYIIKCDDVITDDSGDIKELICSIDYDTLGVNPTDRKVKGVIGWVSATNHKVVTVNNYDKLFTKSWFSSDDDIFNFINPDSLIISQALVEPCINEIADGTTIQFERIGYFVKTQSTINRIITLKQSKSILKLLAK